MLLIIVAMLKRFSGAAEGIPVYDQVLKSFSMSDAGAAWKLYRLFLSMGLSRSVMC